MRRTANERLGLQSTSKKTARVLASSLAKIAREFHSRGWAQGTSGNYSAVLKHDPLKLLITSSGLDKSVLTERAFLEIDNNGVVRAGDGKPSADTFLHLA